jgi:hypothetical protein
MYGDRMRVAVITAACSSACSLVYTTAPPAPLPDRGGISCSELPAAPIVDVLLAPVASLAGAFAAIEINNHVRNTGDGLFLASVLVVPAAFLASAGVGLSRNVRCHNAKLELRENGRDPDAPVAATLGAAGGEKLAHDGLLAAERGDCKVVRAIADQLRTLDEPLVLDKYLHDAGVAQCMP